MTRVRLTGLAVAAACAAWPLAARAQAPGPMPPMAPAIADTQLAPGPAPRVEYYVGAPVYSLGDEGGPAAARRNNAESRRYEAALRANPAFRDHRMRQECSAITEPALLQGCIDTFGDRTAAAVRTGPSTEDGQDEP